MAIKIDGVLYSEKDRKAIKKALEKPRKITNSFLGYKASFMDGLELYEGTITEDREDDFYIIEARNRNIHKNGEVQSCIVPKGDVRIINK